MDKVFYESLLLSYANKNIDVKRDMSHVLSHKNADKFEKITDILLIDRNGDNNLTIEDILLIRKDPVAIVSLISAIIFNIPEANVEDVMRSIVFIIIELLPQKTKLFNENPEKRKEQIEQLFMFLEVVAKFLNSSKQIKELLNKIKKCTVNCFVCKKNNADTHLKKLEKQIENIRLTN